MEPAASPPRRCSSEPSSLRGESKPTSPPAEGAADDAELGHFDEWSPFLDRSEGDPLLRTLVCVISPCSLTWAQFLVVNSSAHLAVIRPLALTTAGAGSA